MTPRAFGLMVVLICIPPLIGCRHDEKPTVDGGSHEDASQEDASPEDAAPVFLDCPSYCTEIQAHCIGANTQYDDTPSCMATCASFEVGTSTITDTSGNTLGCRIYHAGAPTRTDPGTECAQAGPAGDLLRADAGTPMGCSGGDLCQSFCTLEIKACGSLDVPSTAIPRTPPTIPYSSTRIWPTAWACATRICGAITTRRTCTARWQRATRSPAAWGRQPEPRFLSMPEKCSAERRATSPAGGALGPRRPDLVLVSDQPNAVVQ